MKEVTAVLLPGLDGTGELFEPFVKATTPGIKTVVVDYPFHESSINTLAQRVQEKLVDRSVIIAESFSGPIGVRVAKDARVLALVLCNSFIKSPLSTAFRHLAIAPLFSLPIPRFLLRYTLLGRQASPLLVEKTRRAIRRIPPNVLARRVREVIEMDEREKLRDLSKPVLYLRGLSDRLVSETSWITVRKARPDAQVIPLEGPHMLLQVSPNECWEAFVRFIEETDSIRNAHS